MTKGEKLRQIDLLIEFNNDSKLLELLDLVGQEYADLVIEKIKVGEPFGADATMQAGARAFRNALTQSIDVLNEKYKEIEKEVE